MSERPRRAPPTRVEPGAGSVPVRTVLAVRQRNVALWLAVGIGLLFLIDFVLQSLDAWTGWDSEAWFQFVRLFDLNAESSIPTWFSVIQLFSAALIAVVIALARRRTGDPFTRHWWLLAILVAGFSLDEAAQIHDAPSREPLRDVLGTSGLLRYPWVVAAIVSALIVAFVMFRFVRSLPRSTRRQLILSAVVFGSGAIGMEMVSGWFADRYPDDDLGFQMLTSIEEVLELAGGTILIYTLIGYTRDWIGETRIVWDDRPLPDTRCDEETSS